MSYPSTVDQGIPGCHIHRPWIREFQDVISIDHGSRNSRVLYLSTIGSGNSRISFPSTMGSGNSRISYPLTMDQGIPGCYIHRPWIGEFQDVISINHGSGYGTDAEIQLPLKRFPDSSVSSLIRTGWLGWASHHQKLAPIPMGG